MHAMKSARQPGADTGVAGEAASAPRHEVAVYATQAECADLVLRFLRAGLQAAAPTLLAVSPGVAELLRPAVLETGGLAESATIAEFGRNPGRLIAALWDFAGRNDGVPVQCVKEPLWAGRSAAEVTEVLRHEALVNLAFAGQPLSLLCVYQRQLLTGSGLTATRLTHPILRTAGGSTASGSYLGAGVLPPECDQPLAPPPPGALALTYREDLGQVRQRAQAAAAAAGLPADRAADLVLAVSEVAANTLRHAGGDGELVAWHTQNEVVCEIRDHGTVSDPLAGRRRPAELGPGHGLWLVNQVCDLVELRASAARTIVRMHVNVG